MHNPCDPAGPARWFTRAQCRLGLFHSPLPANTPSLCLAFCVRAAASDMGRVVAAPHLRWNHPQIHSAFSSGCRFPILSQNTMDCVNTSFTTHPCGKLSPGSNTPDVAGQHLAWSGRRSAARLPLRRRAASILRAHYPETLSISVDHAWSPRMFCQTVSVYHRVT